MNILGRRGYFGLEIGCVAEGTTVLIWVRLGGAWSGTACEIQALFAGPLRVTLLSLSDQASTVLFSKLLPGGK